MLRSTGFYHLDSDVQQDGAHGVGYSSLFSSPSRHGDFYLDVGTVSLLKLYTQRQSNALNSTISLLLSGPTSGARLTIWIEKRTHLRHMKKVL